MVLLKSLILVSLVLLFHLSVLSLMRSSLSGTELLRSFSVSSLTLFLLTFGLSEPSSVRWSLRSRSFLVILRLISCKNFFFFSVFSFFFRVFLFFFSVFSLSLSNFSLLFSLVSRSSVSSVLLLRRSGQESLLFLTGTLISHLGPH